MLLVPLTHYFEIGASQHGFVPQRGTLTAWKTLMSEVIPSRNILEIDFEGYFPSIQPDMVSKCMVDHQVPSWVIEFYYLLNGSKPVQSFTLKDHTAESVKLPDFLGADVYAQAFISQQRKIWIRRGLSREQMTKSLNFWVKRLTEAQNQRIGILQSVYGNKLNYDTNFQDERSRRYQTDGTRNHTEGLPQGAGTSPYLSILYLDYIMVQVQKDYPSIHYLAYADDIIIYSNDDKEFARFLLDSGLGLSENSTNMVDYSAAQITHQDKGFSGARTSNLTTTRTSQQHPNPSRVRSSILRPRRNDPLEPYGLTYGLSLDKPSRFSAIRIPQGPTYKAQGDPFGRFNLIVAWKKSQVSKLQNEWRMPWLKFLGLKWINETQQLESDTRQGRHLIWSFHNLTSHAHFLEYEMLPRRHYGYMLFILVLMLGSLSIDRLIYLLQLVTGRNSPRKVLQRHLSTTEQKMRRLMSPSVMCKRDVIVLTLLAQTIKRMYKTTRSLIHPYNLMDTTTPSVLNNLSHFKGVYSGILLSRLYMGSTIIKAFKTSSGLQSFKLRFDTGSPAHVLHSQYPALVNIHNGSSINAHNMLNYSSGKVVKIVGTQTRGQINHLKVPNQRQISTGKCTTR